MKADKVIVTIGTETYTYDLEVFRKMIVFGQKTLQNISKAEGKMPKSEMQALDEIYNLQMKYPQLI